MHAYDPMGDATNPPDLYA